jgi:hypothetical protein
MEAIPGLLKSLKIPALYAGRAIRRRTSRGGWATACWPPCPRPTNQRPAPASGAARPPSRIVYSLTPIFCMQEEQSGASHLVAAGQQPAGLPVPGQPIRGRLQQVAQRGHPRA